MNWIKYVLHLLRHYVQYWLIMIIQAIGKFFYGDSCSAGQIEKKVSRILVIRLDEIGDMVMMSPFLRELRRNYPMAYITLVVKSETYNLVELCPYVHEVLRFPRKVGRCLFYRNLWSAFVFSYHYLKKEHYDLALVPRFDADAGYGAGMLAFLSGAKRRVGYSERVLPHKMISDKGYDGFYTDLLLPEVSVVSHEVERNLYVLRHIGGTVIDDFLELWFDDTDKVRVQKLLSFIEEPLIKIALSIASGSPRREWPIENFIELIKELFPKKKICWVIVGAGKRAVDSAQQIEKEYPFVINLVNKTSLRETVAVIADCDMYLGGDTGLMHIAAALGKSGVVISCHPIGADENHANSPKRFGPWQSPMRIIRPKALRGCEHGCNQEDAHCICEIKVENVQQCLFDSLTCRDICLSCGEGKNA